MFSKHIIYSLLPEFAYFVNAKVGEVTSHYRNVKGLNTPNRKCLREVAEGLIISTYRSVKCANASYKVA